MATKFSMTRDINGYNGFGLIPTDTQYSATLTTITDTTLTVPSFSSIGGLDYTYGASLTGDNAKPRLLAIIVEDPGTAVWVALNTTAGAPAGSTFAATSSCMNPAAIEVKGGDVLHFYSTGIGVNVSVRFYWLT